MRILHIHTEMSGGGIEAMIYNLSSEMSRQGHDVTVCSIYEPKDTDVYWHCLPDSVAKKTLGKKSAGFSVKEVFSIYRFIRDGHFDVVHIHGFFYYYIVAVFLLGRRIKFFYTIHNDAEKEVFGWDRRLLPLRKFAFKARLITPVTISKVSQKSFLDFYHFGATMVYNGIRKPDVSTDLHPLAPYRITDKTRVFLHPGRITEQKNQMVLVKSFQRLIEEHEDVVLVIAGNKEDSEIYKAIEPYFSDRIIYLGIRDDVPQLFCDADAFCLPSLWEGMPVTLLEAISLGCIPICTPVGGVPEVITDGQNGLLSPEPTVDAYYSTLRRFLSMDDNSIREMKAAAIESFQQFEISNTAGRYLALYDEESKRQ